jgi:hypothetical protein
MRGMSGDKTGTKLRERVWIDKFDHDTDPPRLVETVFREVDRSTDPPTVTTRVTNAAGEITAQTRGPLHAQETETARAETARAETARRAEDAGGSSYVQRHDGHEVTAPKQIDPWMLVSLMGRAATECGLELAEAVAYFKAVTSRVSTNTVDGAPPMDPWAAIQIAIEIARTGFVVREGEAPVTLSPEAALKFLAIVSGEQRAAALGTLAKQPAGTQ